MIRRFAAALAAVALFVAIGCEPSKPTGSTAPVAPPSGVKMPDIKGPPTPGGGGGPKTPAGPKGAD